LIKTVDHEFGIRNYDEICGILKKNPNISAQVVTAYKRLGPFDHFEHELEDLDEEAG